MIESAARCCCLFCSVSRSRTASSFWANVWACASCSWYSVSVSSGFMSVSPHYADENDAGGCYRGNVASCARYDYDGHGRASYGEHRLLSPSMS